MTGRTSAQVLNYASIPRIGIKATMKTIPLTVVQQAVLLEVLRIHLEQADDDMPNKHPEVQKLYSSWLNLVRDAQRAVEALV